MRKTTISERNTETKVYDENGEYKGTRESTSTQKSTTHGLNRAALGGFLSIVVAILVFNVISKATDVNGQGQLITKTDITFTEYNSTKSILNLSMVNLLAKANEEIETTTHVPEIPKIEGDWSILSIDLNPVKTIINALTGLINIIIQMTNSIVDLGIIIKYLVFENETVTKAITKINA